MDLPRMDSTRPVHFCVSFFLGVNVVFVFRTSKGQSVMMVWRVIKMRKLTLPRYHGGPLKVSNILGPRSHRTRSTLQHAHANYGTHCSKWECSHRLHATSKGLHANLLTRPERALSAIKPETASLEKPPAGQDV